MFVSILRKLVTPEQYVEIAAGMDAAVKIKRPSEVDMHMGKTAYECGLEHGVCGLYEILKQFTQDERIAIIGNLYLYEKEIQEQRPETRMDVVRKYLNNKEE